MKNSLLIATFVVASAGAVGATVGAFTGSLENLAGSDTLYDVTTDLVTPYNATTNPYGCQLIQPQGTIGYMGGGSGAGENAMIASPPTQYVAPMSKMMDTGICAHTPAPAAGCVIGLDGVAILGATANSGIPQCNGVSPAQDDAGCGSVTDLANGVNYSRTPINACGQTFSSYASILRILWFGGASGAQNCDSMIRFCLSNNYGDFFENASCGAAGSGDAQVTQCQQIRHLFRRDDASGTTDIFGSLLGFPGPSIEKGGVQVENVPAVVDQGLPVAANEYFMGSDSFCNDSQNLAAPFKATPEGQQIGVENAFPSLVSNYAANDMQDRDPIRRDCFSGSGGKLEEVCGPPTQDPTIPGKACTTAAQCTALGGVCASGTCTCTNNVCTYPQGTTSEGFAVQCVADTDCVAQNVPSSCSNPANCTTNIGGICAQAQYDEEQNPALVCLQGSCNCLQGQCWYNTATLGLVLPIVTTNHLDAEASSTQFPTVTCNSTAQVNAPTYQNAVTKKYTILGLCPNGDYPAGGACTVPAYTAPGALYGNPNCYNTGALSVSPISDGQASFISSGGTVKPATSIAGVSPASVDPRVFNAYAYTNSDPNWATDGNNWDFAWDDSNRPVAGNAFFRLHYFPKLNAQGNPIAGTGTMANAAEVAQGTTICTYTDATDQIGCLVTANPCSFGYAGRGAVNNSLTTSIRVLGVPSTTECIQEFQYPYTRKLYLNSVFGFAGATTAPELQLAQCESDAGIVDPALLKEGFVQLPTNVNNGQPYCEDYNELMLCTAAQSGGVNNPGCTNVQGTLGLCPGINTTCGNGIKEAYEDCDLGAVLNGVADAGPDAAGNGFNGCSQTCRYNQ
ncbi:MAG: hypothetical protein ABTD50_03120 [Polyangiaceae bacterium]|jgi:ABC-type phosphate transport system substrate-binding protein